MHALIGNTKLTKDHSCLFQAATSSNTTAKPDPSSVCTKRSMLLRNAPRLSIFTPPTTPLDPTRSVRWWRRQRGCPSTSIWSPATRLFRRCSLRGPFQISKRVEVVERTSNTKWSKNKSAFIQWAHVIREILICSFPYILKMSIVSNLIAPNNEGNLKRSCRSSVPKYFWL